jgi:hypothetical protein
MGPRPKPVRKTAKRMRVGTWVETRRISPKRTKAQDKGRLLEIVRAGGPGWWGLGGGCCLVASFIRNELRVRLRRRPVQKAVPAVTVRVRMWPVRGVAKFAARWVANWAGSSWERSV